ncbi:MAG: hypothetical protein EWV89_09955 [Microcystis wesenbergii Mw_QC_B_20070930_S4]|nr:MAG: hypothetical protein EWV89_09955 [Microcystis wesenbergii Mw_QC_B_20070930_S4]
MGSHVSYQLSVISYQLSVTSYQLSREAQLFVGWVSALRNPCGRWVSCFNRSAELTAEAQPTFPVIRCELSVIRCEFLVY